MIFVFFYYFVFLMLDTLNLLQEVLFGEKFI